MKAATTYPRDRLQQEIAKYGLHSILDGYRKRVASNPNDMELRVALSDLLLLVGDSAEALSNATSALRCPPHCADCYQQIIFVLLSTNHSLKPVKPLLDRLPELGGYDPDRHGMSPELEHLGGLGWHTTVVRLGVEADALEVSVGRSGALAIARSLVEVDRSRDAYELLGTARVTVAPTRTNEKFVRLADRHVAAMVARSRPSSEDLRDEHLNSRATSARAGPRLDGRADEHGASGQQRGQQSQGTPRSSRERLAALNLRSRELQYAEPQMKSATQRRLEALRARLSGLDDLGGE